VESGTGWAIYDPTKNAWTLSKETENVRKSVAELPDGRVVLFGVEDGYTYKSVSFLDTKTGDVTKAPKAATCLPHYDAETIPLADGTVVLFGGDLYNNIAAEPELWTPQGGTALPGLEKPFEKQIKARAKYDEKEAKRSARG
jgi:hypothetical protein